MVISDPINRFYISYTFLDSSILYTGSHTDNINKSSIFFFCLDYYRGISSFSPQIMTASGATFLNLSETYWLIASQPNYPDIAVWQSSTVSKETLIAFRDTQHTSWISMPHEDQWTLRVETGEVPIPSAVWLFGSGLLGLIGMARRKKTI